MKDSLYERAKSETRLAIYYAKEMIEELGRDKALELIGRAYQKYSNDVFSEPYLDIPLEKRFYKFNICLTLFANDLERWNKNAVSTFTLFFRGLAPQQITRETGIHLTTAYRHMREKHLEDYQKMFALVSGSSPTGSSSGLRF